MGEELQKKEEDIFKKNLNTKYKITVFQNMRLGTEKPDGQE